MRWCSPIREIAELPADHFYLGIPPEGQNFARRATDTLRLFPDLGISPLPAGWTPSMEDKSDQPRVARYWYDGFSKDFKFGLESWFFRFLNNLGKFLETQMESPNEFWLMIWAIFFDVPFCVDFYLFLEGSKPWKLSSRLDGSTIFTKSTFSKMGWKMLDLGGIKIILGSSSDTKSIKTCIQERLFFQHRIFWIFFRFWQHFGRSGRSSMVPS